MIEYIKKLKACVKWFMELEDGYQTEQERLQNLYESEEKRHAEIGSHHPFCLITLNNSLALFGMVGVVL